jgi:catechol-2,3-dioxygenase
MAISRLNHAVLYVRDARRAAAFYVDVLGFEVLASDSLGRYAFLRAGGSDNHHDLGLFGLGPDAPGPARGAVGLYHLAWQVDTIDELAALRQRLLEVGSLVGESDHGASKSLYALDPDGNEFEVMWQVPREVWEALAPDAMTLPLDLASEQARWSGVVTH